MHALRLQILLKLSIISKLISEGIAYPQTPDLSAREMFGLNSAAFTQNLDKFDSKPIAVVYSGVEIFRFTWIPPFEKPHRFQVEKKGQTWIAEDRRLSGKGAYDWGKLERVAVRLLSKQQVNALSVLQKPEFWREPNALEIAFMLTAGDGEIWILEQLSRDGHRQLVLRNPEDLEIASGNSNVRSSEKYTAILRLLREVFGAGHREQGGGIKSGNQDSGSRARGAESNERTKVTDEPNR
jgi:hypothetical protein